MVVTINAARFVEALRDRLEMEAFLREPVTLNNGWLSSVPPRPRRCGDHDYISKDEAAKIFKEEFGENITDVLDFNPLPPSFKIRLKPPFRPPPLRVPFGSRRGTRRH